MISFYKIFYVSFIELLVLLNFLYMYFIGSDPNVLSPCNARRSDPEDSPPANNIPASFSSCTPPAFPSIFL